MYKIFVGLLLSLLTLQAFGQSYEAYMKQATTMQMYGNDSCYLIINKAIEVAPSKDKAMFAKSLVKGHILYAVW